MSIYPAGQCTDYVASRFAWINGAGNLGDAWNWAANWRLKGYPTTTTPTPGSVMVAPPGVAGAGGYGHVAVVESVAPDGSFRVSEQNFASGGTGGLGVTDVRPIPRYVPGMVFLLPPGGVTNAPGVSGLTAGGTVLASTGPSVSDIPVIGPGISAVLGTVVAIVEMAGGALLIVLGAVMVAKDTAPVQTATKLAKTGAGIVAPEAVAATKLATPRARVAEATTKLKAERRSNVTEQRQNERTERKREAAESAAALKANRKTTTRPSGYYPNKGKTKAAGAAAARAAHRDDDAGRREETRKQAAALAW